MFKSKNYDLDACFPHYKDDSKEGKRIYHDVLYKSEKDVFDQYYYYTYRDFKRLGFDVNDKEVKRAIYAQSYRNFDIWLAGQMSKNPDGVLAKRYGKKKLSSKLFDWIMYHIDDFGTGDADFFDFSF